jgi:hypothetical protein
VLFDEQFDKASEPFEKLQEAAFQQHLNGFLRFHIEKLVAGFMKCVREEKYPDVPGFEQFSHPSGASDASTPSRITDASGNPAPRHRALGALASMTGNPRVNSLMHTHGRHGDSFSEAVRTLVRASAGSAMFPAPGDRVLVPNPERTGGPGQPDHSAADYEQAPFADVWRIDHRTHLQNDPMWLTWFGTVQLQPTAVLPAEDDVPQHLRYIRCRLLFTSASKGTQGFSTRSWKSSRILNWNRGPLVGLGVLTQQTGVAFTHHSEVRCPARVGGRRASGHGRQPKR